MTAPDAPLDGTSPSLPPACRPSDRDGCSICGDAGREATVLRVVKEGRTAHVRLDEGEEASVALDLLHPIRAGDRLIVHLGFAIARVQEDIE